MLHHRLRTATALADHKIQLECYHPTAKYTTPWWFCDHLGTEGLGNTTESEEYLYADIPTAGRLGKLGSLYSRFHPTESTDLEVPLPDPARQTHDTVSQVVSLDTNERFSQLCVVANLVRLGSSVNWLINSVTIGEGVVRVFRTKRSPTEESKKAHQDPVLESSSCQRRDWCKVNIGEERMLWVDNSQNIGLKVRVTEQRASKVQPLLLNKEDEAAVTYRVEYQGRPILGLFLIVYAC